MGFKTIVGVTLGLFALSYAARKKNLFENVQFQITKIKIGGTLLLPKLILVINAINPVDASVELTRITGKVIVDNLTTVGLVQFDTPTKIKPKDVTSLEIPIDIRFDGIVETITKLIKGKEGSYTFDGVITLDGFSVPVKRTEKF